MKIALLSYSTKPRGGVVHTLALAEALAALGEDVTVWTLGRGGDAGFFRPVHPAVRIQIVPFPDGPPEESVGARILRSITTLRNAFDPTPYDVVHAQDCISANAAGPCVRTVHHLDHFTTPPDSPPATNERSSSRTPTSAYRLPWQGSWRRAGASRHRSSRTAWPTTVSPPPTPPRERVGARASARTSSPSAASNPARAPDLLEAYALLRATRPDLRLVIAGGETLFDYRDYRAGWEARAAELAVEPVVLGQVDEGGLPSLVAAADVFAFPSLKEGSGSRRWRRWRRGFRWWCGICRCCGMCSARPLDSPRLQRTWLPNSGTRSRRRTRTGVPPGALSPPATPGTRRRAVTSPSTVPWVLARERPLPTRALTPRPIRVTVRAPVTGGRPWHRPQRPRQLPAS